VLDEVAEAEKVAADEAEVTAEVEKLVQSSGGKEEDIKKLLELPQTRRSVEQVIVRRKTLQRLTEIARSSAEDKVQ
jgi:FKBP-type peptidyl-prolyl cis-trans isomerase (trigger factor)